MPNAPKPNNYYCSNNNCTYQTNAESSTDASSELYRDGGSDENKVSSCPTCKNDSLVFLHA